MHTGGSNREERGESWRRIPASLGEEGFSRVSAYLRDRPEIASYSVDSSGVLARFRDDAPLFALLEIESYVDSEDCAERERRAALEKAETGKGPVRSVLEVLYSPKTWKSARDDLKGSLVFEAISAYFAGLAGWPAAKKLGHVMSLQDAEILAITQMTNGIGFTVGTLAGMGILQHVDKEKDGIKKYDAIARAGVLAIQAAPAFIAAAPESYAIILPIANVAYSAGLKLNAVLDPRRIYHQSLEERDYPTLLAQKNVIYGLANGAGWFTSLFLSKVFGEEADIPLIAAGTVGGLAAGVAASYCIRWEVPTDREFASLAADLVSGEPREEYTGRLEKAVAKARGAFRKLKDRIGGKGRGSGEGEDGSSPAGKRGARSEPLFCPSLEIFYEAASQRGYSEAEASREISRSFEAGRGWAAVPSEDEGAAVVFLGRPGEEVSLWETFDPVCYSTAYGRVRRAGGVSEEDSRILAEGLSMYLRAKYDKSAVRLAM